MGTDMADVGALALVPGFGTSEPCCRDGVDVPGDGVVTLLPVFVSGFAVSALSSAGGGVGVVSGTSFLGGVVLASAALGCSFEGEFVFFAQPANSIKLVKTRATFDTEAFLVFSIQLR